MSVVLGRRHRLLHVRSLLTTWYDREQEVHQFNSWPLFDSELTSGKGDPTVTATGRKKGITSTSSRISSRRNAWRENYWAFTIGSSVMQDSERPYWIGSQWREMSWNGQIGERRPHAPHHSRWNSSLSKQLVDPFEFCWFRHDARKASSWFQRSIVYLATPQEPRRHSLLPKVAKLFLILVELARCLVAFFIWVSPRWWTQHWSIGETC